MDLDDETLETLGFGQQKAYEVLAADMEYARAAYNKYMREYMREYRKLNLDRLREQKRKTQKVWVKSEKGKAYIKAYRQTEKYKESQRKRDNAYRGRLSKDPVKRAKYLARQLKKDRKRRAALKKAGQHSLTTTKQT